jgi:rhamnogalacturonan endolyase
MKQPKALFLIIAMILFTLVTVSAATGVSLQFYNGNLATSSNTIYLNFNLVNTGTDPIALSNVKMRYYFTNDGTQSTSFACDWASAGNSNVTGTMVSITPVTGADRYIEVGFASSAGTLAAGASTEVRIRVWKSDWSNFDQSNDYSFSPTATSYVAWSKVPVYISGTLYWGTPAGGTVTTPTPVSSGIVTPTPPRTPTPTSPRTPTPAGVTPTPTSTRTAAPTATQPVSTPVPGNARQMENLNRGLVAVKVSNGVYLGWRLLGTDSSSVSFNVYRNGTKITSSPITNSTNYLDTAGTSSSSYYIRPVVDGTEQQQSESAGVWSQNYLSIPLQIPAGGTTPDGVAYTYSANDCSVGDLDGDHQYEIVLKWDPSNAKDNSQSGYTGNVYLDAYKMNGTRMWRIDLGRNIRAGAHYTQFMVYDLDGDGKAEVACKTADATVDGTGKVIGSASADYRNSSGYVLSGPEYLTIFNGQTGAALTTVNYEPARGTVSSWGDSYGNRVDRFLACIAYLDGTRPSLVMCRGYYTRTVLVAYNWRGGSLTKVWTFDSNNNTSYAGQGNHNLSVGDVDGDGKDEIVYGSCTINDNGQGLYSTGLGHGDAMHLGDFDPNRAGLEVWQCHEGGSGATFRDARTGSTIFKYSNSGDVGRACCDDMTASYKGCEAWAAGTSLYNCTGGNAGSSPSSCNFVIWWDGDLLRELLDGTTISKYGGSSLLSASGCSSNNGTKSNPCLTADLFGDWREEVIFRTSDSSALRIYTTTTVTSNRLFTLMHDPQYRLSVAWQNVAYNQPPHVGFYLGDGMVLPAMPKIYLAP